MITPSEAIRQLDEMQSQIVHGKRIFGDIADCIKELVEEQAWSAAENKELRQRPTFQKVQDLLLKLAQQQKEIQRLQALVAASTPSQPAPQEKK